MTQAEDLLALAAGFRFGTDRQHEPFGIEAGSSIALPLRGGHGSVRSTLSRMYAGGHGRAPSANALSDTMLSLEGLASAGPQWDIHLRAARTGDVVWVDLGTPDGQLIQVAADGWRLVPGGGDGVPLFRRTRLTGPLPIPSSSGSLEEFRCLLRVGDDAWPLVLAWLLAVLLLPREAVPILILSGEHGTAKSSQSRLLVCLLDPSDAPLRTAPRDVESWIVAGAASRVVAIDNISVIEPWLSDAMCRAVTGDALVRRALYTDSDVSVVSLRRVLLLNGIAPPVVRGDLADRVLRVPLDVIPDDQRRTDKELAAQWEQVHPIAFGGLLDLAAQVLAVLPGIKLESLPRMADYAEVLAAVDKVLGTEGLQFYLGLREDLAAETVESDEVASEIMAFARSRSWTHEPVWMGTVRELKDEIELKWIADSEGPVHFPEWWPKNARIMAARLTRAAPALRATGMSIEKLPQQGKKRQPDRYRIVFAGQQPGDHEDGTGDVGDKGDSAVSPSPSLSPPVPAGQGAFGDRGDRKDGFPPPALLPSADRCADCGERSGANDLCLSCIWVTSQPGNFTKGL